MGIRTARLERGREAEATRERLAVEDAEAKKLKTLIKLAEENKEDCLCGGPQKRKRGKDGRVTPKDTCPGNIG